MESLPDTLFRILLVVLGVGLVIFVHELGHFIAARIHKVRVEVFSIGFGPRLFGLQRGDTLYQVAIIPIGGYVRMAGEDRRLDGLEPRSDDLAAKSVGARFFIYSGGVLMNVLFALVVFPIIFFVGVPFPPPVIDEPAAGGGAWAAGLTEGTEVLEVDGHRIFDFMQIPTAVALGGSDGVEMLVREPGAAAPRAVHVQPKKHEFIGVYDAGVTPVLERDDEGNYVLVVAKDTPAWDAGLRSGDRLVSVLDGRPGFGIPSQLMLANLGGGTVELVVQTEEGRREVALEPKLSERLSNPRVGISPPRNLVAGLRHAAELAAFGLGQLREGARIERVDGRAIYRLGDLRAALLDAVAVRGPGTVPFDVRFEDDGRTQLLAHLSSEASALALADCIALDHDRSSTVLVVSPGEPAALAGVRDGDRVVRIDNAPAEEWEDVRSLVGAAGRNNASVTFALERPPADAAGLPTFPELVVTPKALPYPIYGLDLREDQYVFRADSLGEAFSIGALCSWKFTQDCWLTLKRILVTRDVPVSSLGGIITIGKVSYSWSESGWTKLFFFLCLLSINLAFLNVLPIPVLDGGHLLFLIIEKIKGSPVSDRVLGYSQMVGLVFILGLMVMVTYNDVVRWFLPG